MTIFNFSDWWNVLPNGDKATWILCALTFLYFIATILLWLTAKNTLNESTKLFSILNTAWIDILLVSYYESPNVAPSKPRIIIRYMNFGNTPANIINASL